MQKIKRCSDYIFSTVNKLLPEQSITKSKDKWNKLGGKNARYYVVSKNGFNIDEKTFSESGKESYDQFITQDPTVKKMLGNISEARILNIGCGIGRLEQFFSKDFKEIYGIDISESMIEQAKTRVGHLPNVKFIATNGVDYPFKDNFFDMIFSYIVFQHMPSKEVVKKNFQEVYRTLKPGKLAKIQIRGGHQPYKWQWFYGPSWKKDQAISLVNEIGFKVLKTEGENTKRFWLWITK